MTDPENTETTSTTWEVRKTGRTIRPYADLANAQAHIEHLLRAAHPDFERVSWDDMCCDEGCSYCDSGQPVELHAKWAGEYVGNQSTPYSVAPVTVHLAFDPADCPAEPGRGALSMRAAALCEAASVADAHDAPAVAADLRNLAAGEEAA